MLTNEILTQETLMEDKKQQFVLLANKIEKMEEELNQNREQLMTLMTELGVDTYAQDPSTLAVFKIIKPTGTYVSFRDIDYKRTALQGERGGTVLAKKEAEEAGFRLK